MLEEKLCSKVGDAGHFSEAMGFYVHKNLCQNCGVHNKCVTEGFVTIRWAWLAPNALLYEMQEVNVCTGLISQCPSPSKMQTFTPVSSWTSFIKIFLILTAYGTAVSFKTLIREAWVTPTFFFWLAQSFDSRYVSSQGTLVSSGFCSCPRICISYQSAPLRNSLQENNQVFNQ